MKCLGKSIPILAQAQKTVSRSALCYLSCVICCNAGGTDSEHVWGWRQSSPLANWSNRNSDWCAWEWMADRYRVWWVQCRRYGRWSYREEEQTCFHKHSCTKAALHQKKTCWGIQHLMYRLGNPSWYESMNKWKNRNIQKTCPCIEPTAYATLFSISLCLSKQVVAPAELKASHRPGCCSPTICLRIAFCRTNSIALCDQIPHAHSPLYTPPQQPSTGNPSNASKHEGSTHFISHKTKA